MPAGTKEIQRRIKSIKNTRKITRAMEMVAAAKMKKEIDYVLGVREYAHAAWAVLTNLTRAFEKYKHGLLEVREVKKILVVLVTSNRGLCGAYNAQVIKKLMTQVNNPELLKINRVKNRRINSSVPSDKINFDFLAVGKKGFQYLNSRDKSVIAEFEDLNYTPTPNAIRPLAKIVMDDYIEGKYDKVVVAYTDFKNSLIQEPKLRQLLPISKDDIEKQIDEMGNNMKKPDDLEMEKTPEVDHKVEPKPAEVLSELLPKLVEMQLYHAVLESNASRESARMMAMKNASDAAKDMMEQLEYTYNQIRQTNITQEIAEITSGRVALE